MTTATTPQTIQTSKILTTTTPPKKQFNQVKWPLQQQHQQIIPTSKITTKTKKNSTGKMTVTTIPLKKKQFQQAKWEPQQHHQQIIPTSKIITTTTLKNKSNNPDDNRNTTQKLL